MKNNNKKVKDIYLSANSKALTETNKTKSGVKEMNMWQIKLNI